MLHAEVVNKQNLLLDAEDSDFVDVVGVVFPAPKNNKPSRYDNANNTVKLLQ